MKALFTILIILFSKVVAAQCDTSSMDTIRVIFDMRMNTQYFDYYNSDGTILWKRLKFDSTLIPQGGFALRIRTNKTLEGYAVFKVVNPDNCLTVLVRWLDLNWKDIDGIVKYFEFKR